MNLITHNTIVCFFDGACEPKNPGGNMGIGAVIFINGVEYKSFSHFIPAGNLNSNNVAEYKALLWILNELLHDKLNSQVIQIYGDSMLVVRQMQGSWRIKKGYYVDYAILCKKLLSHFKNTIISWIPREQNQHADDLSKGKLIENNIEFKIQPQQAELNKKPA